MQIKTDHSEIISLRLGEEDIILSILRPIYIYKLDDIVTLNIMRPDREEKFEVIKVVVTDVSHEIIDFGEGEQLIRVKVKKIE